MVTRTVVRILPEERAAAAAAAVEESSSDDGRTDYDDKHDICETMKLCDFQGRQNKVAVGGICDGHSHHGLFYDCIPPNEGTSDEEKDEESFGHNNTACKKRPSLHNDDAGDTKKKKRPKGANKFIDLTDVPTQQPILKNCRGGSSKYQGVSFHKTTNKWHAMIGISGKQYSIGYYEYEEEAAVDYARAFWKYRGEIPKHKKKIDLTDVPTQQPILKSNSKGESSKYKGVSWNKGSNKWTAQITMNGKLHCIGLYDNEEEAAVEYARAFWKYRGKTPKPKQPIDLTDVPKQLPILKSNGKGGSSKYQGVSFQKASNKWRAMIGISGATYAIGSYDNEEEAAVDYARAVWKCRGEIPKPKLRQPIDLTGVPIQLPILRSNGNGGSSKYQGVTFHKATNKWMAQIGINGTNYSIGCYGNEEEAAVDYARALFKYRVDKVERSKKRRTKLLDSTDAPLQPPILNPIKKRPLPEDDTGDNEKTKGRKKAKNLIDLTDVPTQPPILKCLDRGGSSKYQGVFFYKRSNKWKAQIVIDGHNYSIGYYDDEEEAAIDYARAVRKYRPENIQAGKLKEECDLRKSCQTESQHEAVCNDHKQKESDTNPTHLLSVSDKVSFPLELVNKGGRIGIYQPDERKARIARFHAKRSSRVFNRRVTYGVRKNFADSRPRHKGRFVPKSVVEGKDSA